MHIQEKVNIKIDQDIELRQLELSDAKDIFRTIDNQREYLGKWLPFVQFTNEEKDSENFVKTVIAIPEDKREFVCTIQKRNQFVGLIGFKDTDKINKKTEIGYWLSEDYQKQGIMTKAVSKLCDFAFKNLDINRIQIKCAIKNTSSIKIPQRLGFKFEGIEREGELLSGNYFTDLNVYSKLKCDWV